MTAGSCFVRLFPICQTVSFHLTAIYHDKANPIFARKIFQFQNETLLARGLGDKIPPCCKRCSTHIRRMKPRLRATQTLAAFRFMLRARLLDDKFAALYRAGKIHGGVFLGRGQEALSAAVGVSLKKTDVFAPLIRDAAGRLAFGETITGRRAQLSRLVARTDARARRQCPSRQTA